MTDTITHHLLTERAPATRPARTLLLAMRRIAIGGVDDAHAANLMLSDFGMGYRRPLMFLRVLMGEIARVSHNTIHVAPPCCPQMTVGERAILAAIIDGRENPDRSRVALAGITGSLETRAALSIA
jgi:hypothetical protein